MDGNFVDSASLKLWAANLRNLKRHDSQINFSSMRQCEGSCLNLIFFLTKFWLTPGIVVLKVSHLRSWFQVALSIFDVLSKSLI